MICLGNKICTICNILLCGDY